MVLSRFACCCLKTRVTDGREAFCHSDNQRAGHAANCAGRERIRCGEDGCHFYGQGRHPAGIMGATKRIAELLVLANHSATQMNAVRLGNVLGSSGSVVPILQRRIARVGPITIHGCRIYAILCHYRRGGSAAAVCACCQSPFRYSRRAPWKCLPHYQSRPFASGKCRSGSQTDRVPFHGPASWRKISELMTFDEESLAISSVSGLQVVLRSPRPSDQLLNDAIGEIDAALEDRDLGRLLQAILSVVSEYSRRASLTDCAGADENDNSTAAAIRKDFANLTARIRPPERNQSPSWFRFTTFHLRLISTHDFLLLT